MSPYTFAKPCCSVTERWNNGMMEYWEKQEGVHCQAAPLFHYSNLPSFLLAGRLVKNVQVQGARNFEE